MSAYPAESPKYSSQGMESRGLSKLSTPEAWGGKWSRKRWKKPVKGQPCQLAHVPRALRGREGAPSAVHLECGWGAGRGWWQKASGGSCEVGRMLRSCEGLRRGAVSQQGPLQLKERGKEVEVQRLPPPWVPHRCCLSSNPSS